MLRQVPNKVLDFKTSVELIIYIFPDNGTTTRQPTSEPFNTTTTTPTTDSCDIPGTMRCLSMVKPELANFFTMIGQASGQNLKEFCW